MIKLVLFVFCSLMVACGSTPAPVAEPQPVIQTGPPWTTMGLPQDTQDKIEFVCGKTTPLVATLLDTYKDSAREIVTDVAEVPGYSYVEVVLPDSDHNTLMVRRNLDQTVVLISMRDISVLIVNFHTWWLLQTNPAATEAQLLDAAQGNYFCLNFPLESITL